MNSKPEGQTNQQEICVTELNATLNGARVRYLRTGSGPPLLLVHGLLGYSFSWRFNIRVLAQQFTVYAIDQFGAGHSDRPAGMDCSLHAGAERLLRFMDQIGLATCDLLGTSHGGAVGMIAAAQAPQRFRRLILAAPVNPWSAHGKWLAPFLSAPVISALFLRLAPRLRILQEFYLRRLYGNTRRIRAGTLEGYVEPLRRPGSFEYGLGVLRSWNRDLAEVQSVLPHIAHIPTLLIWGSLDAAVNPASAAQLKAQFRDCQLLLLDGVGHLPYEEAPEEFNRAVAEFLR